MALLAPFAIALALSAWIDPYFLTSDGDREASFGQGVCPDADEYCPQGSSSLELSYGLPIRPGSSVAPGRDGFFSSTVLTAFPSHFPPGQREQARKFVRLRGRA